MEEKIHLRKSPTCGELSNCWSSCRL